MQMPIFSKLGLNLYGFYPATINISIFPKKFVLKNPRLTFRGVKWSENHPAEDFSLTKCKLIFKHQIYEGYIYYPHPETKPDHFHDDSTIEVICRYIKNIYYGASVILILKDHFFGI